MTAKKRTEPDGGKSVHLSGHIHFIHTRISTPYSALSHTSAPEKAGSDQRHPDHDVPSAESSIYTLDTDDPWGKKSILSLDGGGVRTFSSLLILRELMRAVGKYERWENAEAKSSAYSPLVNRSPDEEPTPSAGGTRSAPGYLPCHYFDYVSGTGTGGLIAIMLGRLRMNVDEVIKAYKELGAIIFGKPASLWKRLATDHDNHNERESLKNSLPPDRLPSPYEQSDQFKSDEARCKTIVCTMKSSENKDIQTPFLFRSYGPKYTSHSQSKRNADDPNEFKIWQVAQATSAAPSYFKSMHMFEARYYDGATNLNNPSWEVVREVSLLAKESQDGGVDLLLSIGGGNAKDNNPKHMFGTGSRLQELIDISDVVHKKVEVESKLQGFTYFRLDVKKGLQAVRLNEWRPKSGGESTFEKIETATNSYLKQESVRSWIEQCAKSLVDKRTQRAQTMQWERFATGARYRCPINDNCPTPKATFNTRNNLMDHLRTKHNQAPPDTDHYQQIQKLLDQGRVNSG